MSDTYHYFAFYFGLKPEIFHNKKFKRWKVFNAIKCQLLLILGSKIRDDFYFFIYMHFQIFLQDIFYKKSSYFKNLCHNNWFWKIIMFFSSSLFPFSFFFFLIYIFYWRIIALWNFVVFCQTSTWISHRYTYLESERGEWKSWLKAWHSEN